MSLTISSSGYYNSKLIGISPSNNLICYIHSDSPWIQHCSLCKPSMFSVSDLSNGNKCITKWECSQFPIYQMGINVLPISQSCYDGYMRYSPAPCMTHRKYAENVSYYYYYYYCYHYYYFFIMALFLLKYS